MYSLTNDSVLEAYESRKLIELNLMRISIVTFPRYHARKIMEVAADDMLYKLHPTPRWNKAMLEYKWSISFYKGMELWEFIDEIDKISSEKGSIESVIRVELMKLDKENGGNKWQT